MHKLSTGLMIALLVQFPAHSQDYQRAAQRPSQPQTSMERQNTGLTARERAELQRDVGRISREIYPQPPRKGNR